MTSPSPLDRLSGPGNVLGKEAPDGMEFDGLVRSGLARLKDAENDTNSLESRFDLAYGAAHALCLAALRHHGFRLAGRPEGAPRATPRQPRPRMAPLTAEDLTEIDPLPRTPSEAGGTVGMPRLGSTQSAERERKREL